jgi:hypothetical protein
MLLNTIVKTSPCSLAGMVLLWRAQSRDSKQTQQNTGNGLDMLLHPVFQTSPCSSAGVVLL